ncbi:MAG: uracil-xanthine permease family protein [Sciscionella sp.]
MSPTSARHPVDEYRPIRKLVPFGIQHVLVMAATPISSVFLVSKTLGLSASLSEQLLAVAFVLSGIGTLIQSLGPWKVGVRLPFVMLPGGAPLVLFIAIAKQYDLRTATGAVIITGAFYLVVVPTFARLLMRFFPTVVIGTLIVIIGVNLLYFGGVLITGRPGTPGFGNPRDIALGLATVGLTVFFFRVLSGTIRQLAVMLGLIAGAVLAGALGDFHLGPQTTGIVHAPTPFPFGFPHFDLLAALPLMIFSLVSMAETTGQTVLNAEIVGKDIDIHRAVPQTVRGDALVSLLGGFFGSSLLVTSGENIGIVRVSGVRSRFVTVVAGIILILIGILTPIARVISAIPAPVVGGTALVVYAIIIVMGVQMLRKVDFADQGNIVIATAALALGLLPILIPGLYHALPANAQVLLGSGVACGAIVAVVLNIVFHHLRRHPGDTSAAPQRAPDMVPATKS